MLNNIKPEDWNWRWHPADIFFGIWPTWKTVGNRIRYMITGK